VANELMQQQGIYLQPINYPTVPQGQECLRIIATARHLPKHINQLAHGLKKILHHHNTQSAELTIEPQPC
jgi:5-aminolevulinate synthase